MEAILKVLKMLGPILAPLGEQGVEQLFTELVDPWIAGMSDSADLKDLAKCLAPGVKQFIILEIKKI